MPPELSSNDPDGITEQIGHSLKPAHDPVPLPAPTALSGLSGRWSFQFTPDSPVSLGVMVEVMAQTPSVALRLSAEMDKGEVDKLIMWLNRVAAQMDEFS